jgi:hypothetical protein
VSPFSCTDFSISSDQSDAYMRAGSSGTCNATAYRSPRWPSNSATTPPR